MAAISPDQHASRVRGHIAVGRVWGDLQPVLAAFRHAYPEVDVTVKQGLSFTLTEDVQSGELDVAVVGLNPGGLPPGVRMVSTRSIPVGIACSDRHPVARSAEVDARHLSGQVFVGNPRDVASHQAVTALFGRSGVEYRVAFSTGDVPTMLDIVRSDLAISLLPRAAMEPRDGITFVPLAGVAPVCEAGVITSSRPMNDATRSFLALLSEMTPWDVEPGESSEADLPSDFDRVRELELRLRRMEAEVRAASDLKSIASTPGDQRHPELGALTARQSEILSRIAHGQRVKTIADALFISPSTVRNHLALIFQRFGVHSQAALVERIQELRRPPR